MGKASAAIASLVLAAMAAHAQAPTLQRLSDLLQQMNDADVNKRTAATRLLMKHPSRAETVPHLRGLLKDKRTDVRAQAAEVIASCGLGGREAIPDLIAALREEIKPVKGRVGDAIPALRTALLSFGDDVVANLIPLLSGDEKLAIVTVGMLGELEQKAGAAAQKLGSLLRSPNVEVRQKAAWALGRIGKPAASAAKDMLPLLKDFQVSRHIVADALGRTQSKDAVLVLLPLLKDPEDAMRQAAALALGRAGAEAKQAVKALIEAMKDPIAGAAAAEALGLIGPDAREAIRPLGSAMARQNVQLAIASGKALAGIGGDSVPVLCDTLRGTDQPSRRRAVEALVAIGPDTRGSMTVIVEMLGNPREPLVEQSGAVLRGFGIDAARLLFTAVKAKPDRQSPAAKVLSTFGPGAGEAVADLSAALKETNPHVRAVAASALGSMKEEATMAVASLVAALGDDDRDVRERVLRALDAIGPSAKPGIERLAEILAGPDATQATLAAQVLGKIGEPALSRLVTFIADDRPNARRMGLRAIGLVGIVGGGASEAAIKALNDTDVTVRHEAMTACARMQSFDAIPLLTKLLANADAMVRVKAAETFALYGVLGRPAIPALEEMARSPDALSKKAADATLALICPP